MMDDLVVCISDEQLDSLAEFCSCILDRVGGFMEIGGQAIGDFDGRHFTVDCLLHDDLARADAASIRFSTDSSRIAREEAGKRGINVMGTWHVHPPSFGVRFSSTDEGFLFIERMLLKTDDPFAETPRVHLIFDLEKQEVAAYSMKIDVDYSLEPIEPETALIGEIESSKKHAMVISDTGLLDYHPESFRNGDLTGFIRRYNFPQVPSEFEKVFLENYFQKTKVHEFEYARITDNINLFRVTRELQDLKTGFDDVGIEIIK